MNVMYELHFIVCLYLNVFVTIGTSEDDYVQDIYNKFQSH